MLYSLTKGCMLIVWEMQSVDIQSTLPNFASIAIAAGVPTLVKTSSGMLSKYGIFGELARLGAIAAAFAVLL